MSSVQPLLLRAKLHSADAAERDEAWRSFFDEHYARVYRLVCRFGVEPGAIEDLVQRSFLIAFERLGQVEVRDHGAWICGIVVRVVARHRRWSALRQAKSWLLREQPGACPPPVATPEQRAAATQEIESVRSVLARLSPKLRDVLVLCDIEELKPAETARLLNISVNTVRSRRRLARDKFLSLWKQRKEAARE